jgi:hypothetical protein
MINLVMTVDETKVLMQLLDGCVKAYGLQVAEPAVVFGKTLDKLLKEEAAQVPVEQPTATE